MGAAGAGIAEGLFAGAQAFSQARLQKHQETLLERERKAENLQRQMEGIAGNIQKLPRDDKGQIVKSDEYNTMLNSLTQSVQQYRSLYAPHESGALVQRLQKWLHLPQAQQQPQVGMPTVEGEMAAAARPEVPKPEAYRSLPGSVPYQVGEQWMIPEIGPQGQIIARPAPPGFTQPGETPKEEKWTTKGVPRKTEEGYELTQENEKGQYRTIKVSKETGESLTPKPPAKSFAELTYEDWAADPKNQGKNRADFERDKAQWSMQATASQVTDIADGVESGRIPPDLATLGAMAASLKGRVTAELAKRGFNQSQAVVEYRTAQRYMASANSTQQLRLRQAIEKIPPHADLIEDLYRQLKDKGLPSGFKVWNRAALAAARNLPGETGAVATNLEAQINDLSSELGNVYMGGNTPTDHALEMAGKNLASEWNPETFTMAIDLIRKNVVMRRNAIMSTGPAGIESTSPYMPPQQGGATAGPQPTHEWKDGKLIEVKKPQ